MNYTHIPGFSCFYSEEPKPSLLLPEAHFEYEIILVTSGKATFVINHRHYELQEKSLVFISRLERHSFIIRQAPYCRYVASVSGDLILSGIRDTELLSVFLQRPADFCHAVTLSDAAYRQILPLFGQLERELSLRPSFYLTRGGCLLSAILIELYRAHPEVFPRTGHSHLSGAVLDAQREINDHFDRKITLQEIADRNFIDRHTLSIAFRDITGITFKEYLVLFRLSEAKKLLITTDFSVERISGLVGYTNTNNFLRIFKSREVLTPLQYRKQFHGACTPSQTLPPKEASHPASTDPAVSPDPGRYTDGPPH